MKRRRKAKSHHKTDKPTSRKNTQISRPTRLRLLLIFMAICAAVSVVALVQRLFVVDQTGLNGPDPPGQDQSSKRRLPPFVSEDPEFRPVEAATEKLVREATDAAGRLVDRFPENPESIDVLARLQARFGNSAEAVGAWERCLQLDPSYLAAYYGMGSAAVGKEHFGQAADCFRKALELDPASPRAPIDLANALMNLGKLHEVVAVLEKSTNRNRGSMPPFLLLGQAYHQLKQYEKAKTSFEAAVQIAPDYPGAYYGLALACARLGHKDEARKHRETFSKLEALDREQRTRADTAPDDRLSVRHSLAQTYTDAGRVYASHDDAFEAELSWRKAAALDESNTACREDLAALYERTGREPEALLLCEELVKIHPANADYCLNVGLLNARLSQFAAADAAVRRAIELDPENPRYREVHELIKKAE